MHNMKSFFLKLILMPSRLVFRKDWNKKLEIECIAPNFDHEFYLRTYPDVAKSGQNALEHFIVKGWREGRDPSADFSTTSYLQANPDVEKAQINPFWHYLMFGRSEGRLLHIRDTPEPVDQEAVAISEYFDTKYYLRQNSDVRESGVNPLKHFVNYGWKEGRNPNHYFSLQYYLENNPDVLAAGINPFWHYVVAGHEEGRLPSHPGGHKVEALRKVRPLEEMVVEWAKSTTEEKLLLEDIRAFLRETADVFKGLILSVSHDNYHVNSGGVQNCLQREEKAANTRGLAYLNLHPVHPLPRLSHETNAETLLVALILNGKLLGTASMATLTQALQIEFNRFGFRRVVIHQLLGHSPEMLADLVRACDVPHCMLWLHDFITLCPSYALQRNGVSFCGAPQPNSNACTICLYGEERGRHLDRVNAFLNAQTVHVLAPSRFVAEYWSARSPFIPSRVSVVPHLQIKWHDSISEPTNDAVPITVAYIGYPVDYKGWPVFEQLVRAYTDSSQPFRFLVFSATEIALDGVERHEVHVTAEDPDAMQRALREQCVDFVLNWSRCAETFSFTTFEALASGAYVLTNHRSGNVAVTVRDTGLGAVLKDEDALLDFFESGEVEKMTHKLRTQRAMKQSTLVWSDMMFSAPDMANNTKMLA